MESIAYPGRTGALQILHSGHWVQSEEKPLAGSFNRGGECEKPTNELEWRRRCYCSQKILSIRFTTALRLRNR